MTAPLLTQATTAIIESERTKYPMQRFVAERYAQAALAACHAEEMRTLLTEICHCTKNIPESKFPTRHHFEMFTEAYLSARALLAKMDGKP